MYLRSLITVVAAALVATLPASADETRTKVVKFERGKSSAVLTGKITGRESVIYKLNAREGQFLKVSLRPDKQSADYNIYIPGRGPGDEALFTSATGGREYLGQLYKTGDHSISVFLNRAAARRGETAKFDLVISITDKKPGRPRRSQPPGRCRAKLLTIVSPPCASNSAGKRCASSLPSVARTRSSLMSGWMVLPSRGAATMTAASAPAPNTRARAETQHPPLFTFAIHHTPAGRRRGNCGGE